MAKTKKQLEEENEVLTARIAELEEAAEKPAEEEEEEPKKPDEKPAEEEPKESEEDKAAREQQEADEAAAAEKAKLLDPHREALTQLVQTKRITPAQRTELENDIQEGGVTSRHIKSLMALPEGDENRSGAQTTPEGGVGAAMDRLLESVT